MKPCKCVKIIYDYPKKDLVVNHWLQKIFPNSVQRLLIDVKHSIVPYGAYGLLVKYTMHSYPLLPTGVCCVVEFLKSNNLHLAVLSLCSNNIGDDGVSMIVEALQCSRNLTQLSLDHCEISVKGTVLHINVAMMCTFCFIKLLVLII